MNSKTSVSSALGGLAALLRHRPATSFVTLFLRTGMLMPLAWFCLTAGAQTGEWTWMTGSSSGNCALYQCGQIGVFGTLGVPAATNVPGSRWGGVGWTDSAGNLWLFGGYGFDDEGHDAESNDFWRYNPSTNVWTWMGGSDVFGENYGPPGVYGTLGGPAPGNVPGGRDAATSWTDNNGNFWLFGGSGWDANGVRGYLNDLWEYTPATNEWVWVSGSSSTCADPTCTSNPDGIYGKLGTPAPGNVPGGREFATGWADKSGNLWLFGGLGYANSTTEEGELNDLWEFNPSTAEWTWMGGSNASSGVAGVFGTLGEFASANYPGSRYSSTGWTDSSGNFWLFGGQGVVAACPGCTNDTGSVLNDLWEFNPSKNEWAWMSGTQTPRPGFGAPGVYGTLGTPAPGNVPGSREAAAGWADNSGKFWVFGGYAVDVNGNQGNLNDLWEFNPGTSEWTWMGGPDDGACPSTNCNGAAVFGTRGKPAPGNIPGGRQDATSWTDKKGNLWLFGGYYGGQTNDFWVYQPSLGNLPATTPAFSVAAGSYTSTQSVKIADASTGATIYYTLDGTMPTNTSTPYTAAIPITATTTLKAVAEAPGFGNSAVASATYAFVPALSATSLSFGSEDVGASTVSQSVTLTNGSTTPLSIASIVVTGTNASSFVFSNSCGAGLAGGANCTIQGKFAPLATGALKAAITITDSATNSPQSIALTGTGLQGPVTLSAYSLSFGSVALGSSSASQTIVLTNTGTAALTITGITTTGTNASSFVFSNTCEASLVVGGKCSILGHFTPSKAGALTAAITVTDSASTSPQTIALNGTGVGPPAPAMLTSPAPGSTLTSSTVDFSWTAGSQVKQYDLHVGTTGVGSSNIFAGAVSGQSESVAGIPTTGGTLYVRLYSLIADTWDYSDYTYTEFNPPVPAAIASPTPGSKLAGSSVTFSWTAGSQVKQYDLHVGTTGAGSWNIFAGTVAGQSKAVTGIPVTGGTVYVRLYSLIGDVWEYEDYTYTEQ